MPLYDYLTPKLDFKRKFNHRQSFLYKGRLTVRTIRKFRIGSNPESEVRFEIESNLEASQVSNVAAQETAKYCAKFGWPPVNDVADGRSANEVKTPNPLKLAGVPQTPEPISAASGLKFTILWGHVEEILLLNKFYSEC